MNFRACLLFVIGFCASALALSADVAPDMLLRKVTDDVLNIVRTDKDIKNGNTRRAMELVEERVSPNFNFAHMTQLAVGRAWRQTTDDQKHQLTEEFRKLLVRTYSQALTQYKNQTVFFKPFQMKSDDTEARVRTEVRQDGAKPLALDYYLEKSDSGWKVYDIEVEGVSLITNYRETFASEIKKAGVDGLIASLRDKNTADGTGGAKS